MATTKQDRPDLSYQLDLLSSIVNATPDLIFYKDYLQKEGAYIGCNEAFAQFVGKTIEEIVDRNDIELFGEELGSFFRQKDREMLLSKSTKNNEEWVKYPDGREVLLSTSKTPFNSSTGETIGLVGISRDITQYKQAENALRDSKQYLETIIKNEPECVKVIDSKGKLIDMNPAGLEILQAQTLQEVQRRSMTSYVLPKWRSSFVKLFKKVMGGDSGILEFEIQGLKGRHRWLETHAVPMRYLCVMPKARSSLF